MSVWFEGEGEIDRTIEQVKGSLQDLGRHFVGVVGLMPGLTTVELVEQGEGFVTIETNEGMMNRTNITTTMTADGVVIEFDEVYEAGSKVTAHSHFREEFTSTASGVKHHLVMSDVEAPGFLGFFYQRLGSKSIGKAVLQSNKSYLEQASD